MRLALTCALSLSLVVGCSPADQEATDPIPSSGVLNEDTIWDPDAVFSEPRN